MFYRNASMCPVEIAALITLIFCYLVTYFTYYMTVYVITCKLYRLFMDYSCEYLIMTLRQWRSYIFHDFIYDVLSYRFIFIISTERVWHTLTICCLRAIKSLASMSSMFLYKDTPRLLPSNLSSTGADPVFLTS